jgi:hypothetical protein
VGKREPNRQEKGMASRRASVSIEAKNSPVSQELCAN